MTFLIFGAGYSGRAFAQNQAKPVYGTTRDEAKFSALRAANITPLLFDGRQLTPPLTAALRKTTHLIISIAPDKTGDPVLAQADLQQTAPNLEWIAYLSTVGVYGNHGGNWIDETAACRPSLPRNTKRLAVEQAWQTFAQNAGVPLAVLRLGGIYGMGRNIFTTLKTGKARRIIKQGQVFNRIHVADIAGAINHLAEQKQSGLFNICDSEPAPPQDVTTFAASLMGIAPPPEIAFDKAELTPMAHSFYRDNKRIANTLLINTGYQLHYPDYRQALAIMWQSSQW